MPSNVICLRVPLKSYLRICTVRMSSKIIREAMIILEKHEMNKNKNIKSETKQCHQDDLANRIVKIENTLKTIEETLKEISKKLNQD